MLTGERENLARLSIDMVNKNLQYNGRLSPLAKEQIYRSYLKGMTVKDLSLRFGILPQRVKAIVF